MSVSAAAIGLLGVSLVGVACGTFKFRCDPGAAVLVTVVSCVGFALALGVLI